MNIPLKTSKCIATGLMLLVLSGFLISGFLREAQAQPPHPRPPSLFHDSRYHHDRFYPPHGHVIRTMPPGYMKVAHRGRSFFFFDGVWYRPYGPRFMVVAPPIGLFVSILPPFYSTIWVGGIPYYYANNVYYMNSGNGYVVVDQPKENVSEVPPPSDQMFIYPRHGQSEKQKADDRYACHRWAVEQTGFDPTKPPTTMTTKQLIDKRADYQRAIGACLDGRGYTVK